MSGKIVQLNEDVIKDQLKGWYERMDNSQPIVPSMCVG